jgi:hypothetical protein
MKNLDYDEKGPHWSSDQLGLVPEARSVWRGAVIVWLSHRFA